MMLGVDAVFKALADPTRRSLLDELFKEDGQPLGALERRLPMTRFGVMKHLRVLEEANLVTTNRRGREPRGRSAAPARPELQRPVERRGQKRGNLQDHVGDRAG